MSRTKVLWAGTPSMAAALGLTDCASGRLLPMPAAKPLSALTGPKAKAELERLRQAAADRNAKSKAELLKAGGRRLTINLGYIAAGCLAEIREHEGHETDRIAIESALLAYSNSLKRRAKR